MFPASTKAGGQCAVPGPLDACKTPSPGGPVPVPYPNFGMCSSTSKTTKKVKMVGKKVNTTKSKTSRSSGDEAGTVGGLVSNKNMGEVSFKKGSGKVKAEGQPVAHITSLTGHNGSNANVPAGVQVAPSQVKVIVAP